MTRGKIKEHNQNKKEKETIEKEEIKNELKKLEEEFLLPEIKRKLEEVSSSLAELTSDDEVGLKSTQIYDVIARRSNYDILTAGHISYTPQELACAFNMYIDFISKVNKKTKFPPSKTTFCQLIGISTATYNNYLQDPEKREIMLIIDDYIVGNLLTSAQLGELREISTMFTTKAQHGLVEAQAPVVIEHKTEVNIDDIKTKIASMKRKVIDAEYEEKE